MQPFFVAIIFVFLQIYIHELTHIAVKATSENNSINTLNIIFPLQNIA